MRVPTRARSLCARRFLPSVVAPLESRLLLSQGGVASSSPTLGGLNLFDAGLASMSAYRSSHPVGSSDPQAAPIEPASLIVLPLKKAPVKKAPVKKAPAPKAPAPKTAPVPQPAPAPYTPAEVRHAYGFDQLALNGAGQTIAIIDAFDDPTIAGDLHVFDQTYGLPDPTFIKATPTGKPSFDPGWAGEIALDVEWAHAIAPGATILLVEAATSSTTDLYAAVNYAVSHGAKEISMSWGGSVYNGVTAADVNFDHPGVTFLASAGDNGTGALYPSASPYVTSVGGTSLTISTSGNRISETVWSGGGGGLAAPEPFAKYQYGFLGGRSRGTPDVSYDADPNTGVSVYDTSSGVGWEQVGGTSAGAPQWAGLIALVNQGRAARGKPSIGTGLAYGTNQALYALAGGRSYTNVHGDFFDITTGNDGQPAIPGYDLATGLGSPVANKLVPDLINS